MKCYDHTNPYRPRVKRIDLGNDKDLIQMLRSGAVWSINLFWQDGIRGIERGLVPLDECPGVPQKVLDALTMETK